MEYKKTIPVALVVTALSVMLLSADFQRAFAVNVHTYSDANAITCFGYAENANKLIGVINNATSITVIVVAVNVTTNVLTHERTITQASIGTVGTCDNGKYSVAVDETTTSVFIATVKAAGSGMITRINYNTGTIVNQITMDGTGCRPQSMVLIGSQLYVLGRPNAGTCTTDDGSNPSASIVAISKDKSLNNIYRTNTGLSTAVNGNCAVAFPSNFGVVYGCRDGTNNRLILFDSTTATWVNRGSGDTNNITGCTANGSVAYCAKSNGIVVELPLTTTGTTTRLSLAGVRDVTLSGVGTVYVADTTANIKEYSLTTPTWTLSSTNAINSGTTVWLGNGLSDRSTMGFIAGGDIGLFAINEGSSGGGAVPSNPTGGIDCTEPANVNILICRLNSISDSELGSFSDLVGQSFGNATNNIFVQLGLVEAGSDVQTNGVGYALTGVALGILVVMFYLGSGGELNRIPTFVWFLGTLMVVGMMTGFEFIEPLWLIISVLIIIALASAKILSTLEIGGFR